MAYFRCGGGGHSDAEYNNLMDQLIEETATGPIASFTDGANNIPAKDIICHINPTETGTGNKSPQNPYVIGGFTEANITQTDGQTPPLISKVYNIPFGQTVYGGTLNVTTGVLTVTWIRRQIKDLNFRKDTVGSRWGFYTVISSLKAPSLDTETANLKSEIYNTVTASGNTSYTNDLVIFAKTSKQIFIVDRRYSDATSFISAVGDEWLYWELATPTTIQLDPIEVRTLLGANNIYHDCNGDIDVTYRANGALYVEQHPITRGLMAARPTEQIQEQEEQHEEKEINKSEDNKK